MPMTKHQLPNGACFTVDSEELARWMREHPSKLADQAISRGKDDYGIVGNRGSRPSNDFKSAFDSKPNLRGTGL